MMRNFQRDGSVSNTHVGRDFEDKARNYFLQAEGLSLQKNFTVEIGTDIIKKRRRFDLGSEEPAILVECKSHRWTETGNMPSAKVTVWNESMFYFHLAPNYYRKVLFVIRGIHTRRAESLAEYYIRNYSHLIPAGVSIIEFDEASCSTKVFNRP
jgi:hypothetical protein